MAGRARGDKRPQQVRADEQRRQHLEQIRGYGFLAGRGPRRTATVVPAPLQYWQYDPAGRVAVAFTVGIVAVWLAAFGWIGGRSDVVDETPLALGLGLLVLLLNTSRLTVSDHGVSVDVAGTRTAPSRVVPLALIREVRRGTPPPDWPKPTRRGGRWPGRTRIAVRHLAEDGVTEKAFTHWVRDPQAFATALGQKLSG